MTAVPMKLMPMKARSYLNFKSPRCESVDTFIAKNYSGITTQCAMENYFIRSLPHPLKEEIVAEIPQDDNNNNSNILARFLCVPHELDESILYILLNNSNSTNNNKKKKEDAHSIFVGVVYSNIDGRNNTPFKLVQACEHVLVHVTEPQITMLQDILTDVLKCRGLSCSSYFCMQCIDTKFDGDYASNGFCSNKCKELRKNAYMFTIVKCGRDGCDREFKHRHHYDDVIQTKGKGMRPGLWFCSEECVLEYSSSQSRKRLYKAGSSRTTTAKKRRAKKKTTTDTNIDDSVIVEDNSNDNKTTTTTNE